MNDYEKILRLIKHKELSLNDIYNMANIKNDKNTAKILENITLYREIGDMYIDEVLKTYAESNNG